jgi:hypothetical protein
VTDYTRDGRVVRLVVSFKALEVREGGSTRSLKPREQHTFMSNGERDEAVEALVKHLLREGWVVAARAASRRPPAAPKKKRRTR